MSPKAAQFQQSVVVENALSLVREQGWRSLSARALATRLGTSVAPVYGAFASMEELLARVLDEATKILDGYIGEAGSGRAFLDMGLGMVQFARDEPELFRALLEHGGSTGRLAAYTAELRQRLTSEPFLSALGAAAMQRIFDRMWLFTLGLMCSNLYGFSVADSDEAISDLMIGEGALVIYGEAATGGDYRGPAMQAAWDVVRSKTQLKSDKEES